MTRHVILGCGVAGIAAAEAIRKNDPAAEISLVSEDRHGFYSRPGLAYYLTGELPEKQLYIYKPEDWHRLQVHFIHGRVVKLHPADHRLDLADSTSIRYDRLLLATGSCAVRTNLPGGDLDGVVTLDSLEDTRRIVRLARRGRTAVVVGGGILAIELVEGLRARGMRVHYFLRGDRYWPNVLDEAESRLVEERLREEGVGIHPRTEIAAILDRKRQVTAVRTNQGDHIPCNLIAFGIGVRPRIELAQAAGLETDRGILVDDCLQTSATDIFAAGDVAQVLDPITGERLLDLLWQPARLQGQIAGMNMTGLNTRYSRKVAVNVLRLAGVMTSIIGAVGNCNEETIISRGSSETWQPLPNTIAVASGDGINLVRLVIGEKDLKGAVVMGDQMISLPLQELISSQVDITSIRQDLLAGGEKIGQVIMDFWYHWSGRST
jgi:NAD(P)H-nitrite reductase large subunit